MQLGVEDLDFTVALDVAGRDFAGTCRLDKDGLGAFAVQLGQQTLYIQNDLGHIFLHAGNGGKFMLDASNLDAGGSRTGQRREHNAAQRITQGRSVTALQGFDHILAIGSITGSFNALDLGLLNFNHAVPSYILVSVQALSCTLFGSVA